MSCSDDWFSLPAWGSAPEARFWVALEQPGSWGAKALTQSDLDPELGRRLTALVEGAGGRLVLVRDPQGHAATTSGPRTVLVAGGTLDVPWLGTARVEEPGELEPLLAQWLAGDASTMPGWAQPTDPVLLVCTNGKRDQCCAVKARPVVRELAGELAGVVWESSHLNGHRFATTALALPSSQLVARLDADLGRRLVRQPTPLPLGPGHDRGRTLLPEALQVADAWSRAEWGHDGVGLRFTGPDPDGLVVVTRSDGESRRVRVSRRTLDQELPKSCGKTAEPAVVWTAEPA